MGKTSYNNSMYASSRSAIISHLPSSSDDRIYVQTIQYLSTMRNTQTLNSSMELQTLKVNILIFVRSLITNVCSKLFEGTSMEDSYESLVFENDLNSKLYMELDDYLEKFYRENTNFYDLYCEDKNSAFNLMLNSTLNFICSEYGINSYNITTVKHDKFRTCRIITYTFTTSSMKECYISYVKAKKEQSIFNEFPDIFGIGACLS